MGVSARKTPLPLHHHCRLLALTQQPIVLIAHIPLQVRRVDRTALTLRPTLTRREQELRTHRMLYEGVDDMLLASV